jgi:hypothetical protein
MQRKAHWRRIDNRQQDFFFASARNYLQQPRYFRIADAFSAHRLQHSASANRHHGRKSPNNEPIARQQKNFILKRKMSKRRGAGCQLLAFHQDHLRDG